MVGCIAVIARLPEQNIGWTPSRQCVANVLPSMYMFIGLFAGYIVSKSAIIIILYKRRMAAVYISITAIATTLIGIISVEHYYAKYDEAFATLIIRQ